MIKNENEMINKMNMINKEYAHKEIRFFSKKKRK